MGPRGVGLPKAYLASIGSIDFRRIDVFGSVGSVDLTIDIQVHRVLFTGALPVGTLAVPDSSRD